MNAMNNFAIMSYSFHGLQNVGAMDLFGYMETVRHRFDLRAVDIWNGFIKSYDEKYMQLVKQNLEERDLTVASFTCDEAHVWDNNPDVRAGNEKKAWQCLEFAKIIGAKFIRIDAGVREETFSDEQLEYVSKKYKEYCAFAETFGATLGTENHWGVTRDFDELHRLFDAMKDTKSFTHLLHLGSWTVEDEAKKNEYDLKVAPRAAQMHMDFEHCMEAEKIMPGLMASGYKGFWTIESHKGTNEFNNVALQLAQVKRVVAPLVYQGQWEVGPPSVNE